MKKALLFSLVLTFSLFFMNGSCFAQLGYSWAATRQAS